MNRHQTAYRVLMVLAFALVMGATFPTNGYAQCDSGSPGTPGNITFFPQSCSGKDPFEPILAKAKELGMEVCDIGPDFIRRRKRLMRGEKPAAHAYELERRLSKGYEGYRKMFVRDGKWDGSR